MTPLERSYRIVLAVYPPDYLAEREDEIVGTLLAAAPRGSTRPNVREVVGLVRHGIGERLRCFGRPVRRGGLVGASTLALGCATLLVTVVLTLQSGPSTAALPRGFVLVWSSFAAITLVGHLTGGRTRIAVRAVLVLLAAMMLVLGPDATLTPRRLLVPLALFALVSSIRPARGRRVIVAMSLGAGAAMGRALAAPRSRAIGVHTQHTRWAWSAAGMLRGAPVAAGLLAMVLVLVFAWALPRTALTVGLNALPIGLSLLALHSYPGQTWPTGTDVAQPALLGLLAATTSGIALARTLRALPPASAAPAAPVRR